VPFSVPNAPGGFAVTVASSSGYCSIDGVDVADATVFVRCDFNVPFNADGSIADDRRIAATVATIASIADRGGRVVLASHRGRPKGEGYEADFSLEPIAAHLSALLGRPVAFPSHDCLDDQATTAVNGLAPGGIVLLENTRFHSGEKAGDPEFARRLVRSSAVYCNEAFGASHRADASMVAAAACVRPNPCVAGRLLLTELRWLGDAIAEPGRPFVAVLGGAKVSDKLGAIRHLAGTMDTLLVGGAMAFTLLKALGHDTGASVVEEDMVSEAAAIIEAVDQSGTTLELPMDFVCAERPDASLPRTISTCDVPEGLMGLDIGPETQEIFGEILEEAGSVVWTGPMGLFEVAPFDEGTIEVARAICTATERGAATIVGGGDTAAAVAQFGLQDQFSHVSTGGGASLAMLEGEVLPALAVLDRIG
jgi:phosphoglycerate kinase